MNEKLTGIIRGLFIIVLGVLLCMGRAGQAVDIYIGIVSIIAGVTLLALGVLAWSRRDAAGLVSLIAGPAFIVVGITLFTDWLSFSNIIPMLIAVVMGLGIGVAILGILTLTHRDFLYGLGELTLGALLILFAALYMGVPSFQTAFWIIVGCIMIAAGVASIILIALNKKVVTYRKK